MQWFLQLRGAPGPTSGGLRYIEKKRTLASPETVLAVEPLQ
jgi:hypothetical protein